MKTTLNEALELAKNGSWLEAFSVAQQDEGLAPEVTFFEWQEFAVKAMERRAEEARMWANK